MYTIDCSIKEVDKLRLFNKKHIFNLPSIINSVKSYEQNFYNTNANYTKQSSYPPMKELKDYVVSLTLTTQDNIKIKIWDLNPFNSAKYVIFCAGIGHEKSNPLSQKAYLNLIHAGYGVITLDYRGRGKSSGQFSQSGARIDVETVYKYLLNKNIAPQNIGIIGHSLGSAVAADFSTKHTTGFTILINPFTKAADMVKNIAQKADMPEIVRKIIRNLPPFLIPLQNSFNNEKAIKQIKAPLCIIHTQNDTIIPVQQARKLSGMRSGIYYTELYGCDHELNDEKLECCIKFIKNFITY